MTFKHGNITHKQQISAPSGTALLPADAEGPEFEVFGGFILASIRPYGKFCAPCVFVRGSTNSPHC